MNNSNPSPNSSICDNIKFSTLFKISFVLLMLICYCILMLYSKEGKEEDSKEVLIENNDLFLTGSTSVLFETDDYIVLSKIKRNNQVFTQGLFMDTDKTLIESGGLYGESSLQKYNVNTPDDKIFNIPLQSIYFGEGSCLFKGKIYQLTWRESVMYN